MTGRMVTPHVIVRPHRAPYESAAYQAIVPLRRAHAVGPVILMDGVRAGHRATDVLSQAA